MNRKKRVIQTHGERSAPAATAGHLYSVEQAAVILRIGRNQAYRAVKSGTIPAFRVGRVWRVSGPAVDRLVATGSPYE